MGSFANTLFSVLLGWMQTAAYAVWSALSGSGEDSFLSWVGRNWKGIALVLCAVGLISDLGVYLVRWKPYKVWASFFRRLGGRDAGEEEPEGMQEEENYRIRGARREEPEQTGTRRMTVMQEEVLPPEEEEPEIYAPEPVPVTPAGYRVPADSPYRRPEAAEAAPSSREIVEQRLRPRRRRLRLDLFTDEEERLQATPEPQHLIDRRDAYHAPVYPRSWTDNEDTDE